jgi:hypothetical protein
VEGRVPVPHCILPGLHDLRTGEAKICADAFVAWKQLLGTPERLSAEGSDDRGYNVVAGKSADNRRVHVLISDYQSPCTAFRLRVTALPWPADAAVTLRAWQVDRGRRWRLAEEKSASGREITLERPFHAGAVCLVELQRREELKQRGHRSGMAGVGGQSSSSGRRRQCHSCGDCEHSTTPLWAAKPSARQPRRLWLFYKKVDPTAACP